MHEIDLPHTNVLDKSPVVTFGQSIPVNGIFGFHFSKRSQRLNDYSKEIKKVSAV